MIRVVLQKQRGMGLMAEDVEVWMPGAGPSYRNLLANVAAQQAAVNVFERFAYAKGVYHGVVGDGDYGPNCEAAWQALLPGAGGPTTPEMLEGLDALSAAAFRPVELRFALAIARDKYLESRGVHQSEPNAAAAREQFDLVNGSRAWDPTAVRAGEEAVETVSSDSLAVADDGIDESAQVTDVGTTDTAGADLRDVAAAAAAAALRAPSQKRVWLVPVIVAAVLLAVGGGAVWYARRHPARRVRHA